MGPGVKRLCHHVKLYFGQSRLYSEPRQSIQWPDLVLGLPQGRQDVVEKHIPSHSIYVNLRYAAGTTHREPVEHRDSTLSRLCQMLNSR